METGYIAYYQSGEMNNAIIAKGTRLPIATLCIFLQCVFHRVSKH